MSDNLFKGQQVFQELEYIEIEHRNNCYLTFLSLTIKSLLVLNGSAAIALFTKEEFITGEGQDILIYCILGALCAVAAGAGAAFSYAEEATLRKIKCVSSAYEDAIHAMREEVKGNREIEKIEKIEKKNEQSFERMSLKNKDFQRQYDMCSQLPDGVEKHITLLLLNDFKDEQKEDEMMYKENEAQILLNKKYYSQIMQKESDFLKNETFKRTVSSKIFIFLVFICPMIISCICFVRAVDGLWTLLRFSSPLS